MNAVIAVFIGGGLGSVCRYLIHKMGSLYLTSGFPLSTLISNLLSTGILAFFVWYYTEKLSVDSLIYTLVIAGFCGGFSTFSTFSYETFMLLKTNHYFLAFLNVLISIVSALFLIFLLLRNQ